MTTRRDFLAAAATGAVSAPTLLAAQARPDVAAGSPTSGKTRDPMSKTPSLTLNTGAEMPQLGFGTFAIKPSDAAAAVHTALTTGYRLVDTAANYGNEKEVGEGIARAELPRGELFITTKLWIEDFGYDKAMRAFDASLSKLGLQYLDLYLLHWPVPMDFEPTVAAYKAVEKIKADGRIRSIGVSNFKPDHLKTLLDRTSVVPAVNQIELNPLFSQAALREANTRQGIVTESWSPIGGGKNVMRLLTDRQVGAIATKHARTPGQVVLRWHLQHGLVAIPRSTNPKHIAENFDVFNFELSLADMASLDGLESGERGGPDPDAFDLAAFKKLVAQRGK